MADIRNEIDNTSDLERYRSGLMNEAERHALEKKALDDPFLADALEGAEQISPEAFSRDVHDLSSKLAQTTAGHWFTPVRMAAGVLVLIASGLLIYYFNVDGPEQLAMNNAVSTAKDSSVMAQKDSAGLLSMAKHEESAATSPAISKESSKTSLSNERSARQPSAPVEEKKPETTDETKAEDALDKDNVTQLQLAEPKEEAVTESERSRSAARGGAGYKTSRTTDAVSLSSKKIAGRVTSADDGAPLSGVNVFLKGTNQGTVTDVQGNFQMSVPLQNPELLISSIGLETKEVSPGNQGPLAVKLKSDTRQLSELAVSGSGAADDPKVFEFAMPAGGRSAFLKYLETSVRYPVQAVENKTEGRVTVQFTITPEGSLTNFTVLKGIGNGCDEELIRLIQSGPAWSPSRRNQVPIEDKVSVRLRFSLPK